MASKFDIDTSEWRRTLARYLAVSRRDFAQIVNNKGYRVSYKALRYTPRASKEEINQAMAEIVQVDGGSIPRAVAIVQKRMAAGKMPGLPARGANPRSAHWAQFVRAVKREAARRRSAIGYMASGFIPAIRAFAAALGRPATAGGKRAERWPLAKLGGAVPAKFSIAPRAKLWNAAVATNTDDAETKLTGIAGQALERAIDEETEDMRRYIERKIMERWRSMR